MLWSQKKGSKSIKSLLSHMRVVKRVEISNIHNFHVAWYPQWNGQTWHACACPSYGINGTYTPPLITLCAYIRRQSRSREADAFGLLNWLVVYSFETEGILQKACGILRVIRRSRRVPIMEYLWFFIYYLAETYMRNENKKKLGIQWI